MNIDSRLNQLHDMARQLEARQAELISRGGSGGGGSDPMEQRVSRLDARVDGLVDRVGGVEREVAVLNERISHLPSKEFIVKSLVTLLAAIGALTAFADKIQRLVP